MESMIYSRARMAGSRSSAARMMDARSDPAASAAALMAAMSFDGRRVEKFRASSSTDGRPGGRPVGFAGLGFVLGLRFMGGV
jgi:hypothetical protein